METPIEPVVAAREVPKHFNPYPNNRHNYRYVCPHCLRTFLDIKYSESEFCWECGQLLEVIPKRSKE